MYDMIAQAIGIIAMVFIIFSFQGKTSNRVILFQTLGGILFSINFFMLGAIVGGILNAVAAIRGILFMQRKRLHTEHIAWTVGFLCVYAASYVLTFTAFGTAFTLRSGILELLPVLGMTASHIGFVKDDAAAIRRYGLVSSPAWLIYNVINAAIGAIICETLSLVSIFIGMYRHDRKTQD